uniref:Uncharacterized protein LOC113787594 n=1 Tax=Cicer arietinum TaxID=3827 RepID=A0A3Q7Y2X2_CICAR|nr:uncharacterized protein LOC113787594 [Cicer arietinum]
MLHIVYHTIYLAKDQVDVPDKMSSLNRIRLKTSIDIVHWLSLQACAFRGHDETSGSINQDNFLQLIKLLATYNNEVAKVVKHMCEEIGDSKFCIVVDEARDESKSVQMSLVLRFIDKVGLIQERFFFCGTCKDTTTLTIKEELQVAQLEEIAHLLEIDEIVTSKGITNILCQALQQQSQDIVNAMCLIETTKSLIQALREDACDALFTEVKIFCEKYEIEIRDLNDVHSTTRFGRSRLHQGQIIIEHYFRVEIFFTAIDQQLQELNNRFSEQAMDLLTLSCGLTPKDNYKAFNIEKICTLVEKYYPTQKFYLIDSLLRLIMTLSVSTATFERSFSTMKIIKSRLRNKMEAYVLTVNMAIYIAI